MRRRILSLLVLPALLALSSAGLLAPSAGAQRPPGPAEDARRGIRYAGMKPADTGPCRGKYELDRPGRRARCTHGPDPAPPSVGDVRTPRPVASQPSEAVAGAAGTGTVAAPTTAAACIDDGTSGPRVQVIYARPLNVASRYSTLVPYIRQWAADIDAVVNNSALETGGTRRVRFVNDPGCAISVLDVQLSLTGAASLASTITDIENLGLTRTDRKYLMFVDANVYCGIGEIYDDDSAGVTNLNNGSTLIPGMVARIDNGCWGVAGQSVAAHELMHGLGGVQRSAPHATALNHCVDESDRMCYADDTGVVTRQVCPSSHENVFDCNHDDYFHTSPPAGSYLATHWNPAGSRFLTTVTPPPPTTGRYVLSGYGDIYPWTAGTSPMPAGATSSIRWGRNIARDIALLPNGTGGYVLDGEGGVHPFAVGTNPMPPAARTGILWPGWDIARDLVLLPDGTGGYVLDGEGGIHPFAVGANPMPPAARWTILWPGRDIARSLVMSASGAGGYVLDGEGGIHPFAVGISPMPPAARWTILWPGWDIARQLVMLPGGTGGYVLDGEGGIHPWAVGVGAMPPGARWSILWPGWDIARGLVMLPDGTGGYVQDGEGGVHPWATGANLMPPAARWSILWPGTKTGRGASLGS